MEDANPIVKGKTEIIKDNRKKRALRKDKSEQKTSYRVKFNGKVVKLVTVKGGTTYSTYVGNMNKESDKAMLKKIANKGLLKSG